MSDPKEQIFPSSETQAVPLYCSLSGEEIAQITYRLNNPVESYLGGKEIKQPDIIGLIISKLPSYLSHGNQSFQEIIHSPLLLAAVNDDRKILAETSTDIVSDYLRYPKVYFKGDNGSIQIRNLGSIFNLSEAIETFCNPKDLKGRKDISEGFKSILMAYLTKSVHTVASETTNESKLLEIMKKYHLDTSCYQSPEAKILFRDRLVATSKELTSSPFGYNRNEEVATIKMAKFILGKEGEEDIKKIFLQFLPVILIEPAHYWNILEMKGVLSYDKLIKLFGIKVSHQQYDKASLQVSNILQTAKKEWEEKNGYVPYNDLNIGSLFYPIVHPDKK